MIAGRDLIRKADEKDQVDRQPRQPREKSFYVDSAEVGDACRRPMSQACLYPIAESGRGARANPKSQSSVITRGRPCRAICIAAGATPGTGGRRLAAGGEITNGEHFGALANSNRHSL